MIIPSTIPMIEQISPAFARPVLPCLLANTAQMIPPIPNSAPIHPVPVPAYWLRHSLNILLHPELKAYRSYGSNYSPVPWPHRTLRTSQLRLSYKARRNSYKSTFILPPSFLFLTHFSVITVHYTGCLYILPVLFSHYRIS